MQSNTQEQKANLSMAIIKGSNTKDKGTQKKDKTLPVYNIYILCNQYRSCCAKLFAFHSLFCHLRYGVFVCLFATTDKYRRPNWWDNLEWPTPGSPNIMVAVWCAKVCVNKSVGTIFATKSILDKNKENKDQTHYCISWQPYITLETFGYQIS